MVIHKKRMQKIQNFFLITVVEKLNKFHLLNQLSLYLMTKRHVQGLFLAKCFLKL